MDNTENSTGTIARKRILQLWETISRRPLFITAVFFACGITLGRYSGMQAAYIMAAAILAVLVVILLLIKKASLNRNRKVAVLLLVCAASFFLAACLSGNAIAVRSVKTGESLHIEGRVYNEPYVNGYGSKVCFLDNAYIEGEQSGNIKLYIPENSSIRCGDVIEAEADIETPKGVRNPGGFDEKLYLTAQGICCKAYADTTAVKGKSEDASTFFIHARAYLGETIDSIFDAETAPVAKAMLLGDTQDIDEETSEAFKDTGMAHVLAVSGLNAAILIAFIYFVLKLFKVGRTPRLVCALVFVAVYTCLTGLTPSIVRAAIMSCAVLLGTHFGRQNDALNYLSLAFIISLLLRPLDLFTAGFQLSFAAVFGMLTIGEQMRFLWGKTFLKRLRRTGNALSASVGATAGTMPVLAASFNRFSTLSIFVNLLIIPLASAATVLVFVAALFGLMLGNAAAFAAFPAAIVIKAMLLIIRGAAGISFTAVNIASPSLLIMLAGFIMMYVCSKYMLAHVKLKAVLSGVLAAAALMPVLLSGYNGMYLAFLDTGQGDAAFIKTEQGGQYFIDGGREASADEVVSFTVRNGYSPGAAFVSHTDEDHFSGIKALYEANLLHRVYCSWQEESNVKAALPGAEVVPLGAGDTVMLDEVTKALVLYPYRDTPSDGRNDSSLVLMIEYKNKHMLFAGDISGVTETQVFAGLKGVDIYKASHHGSKQSSYRLPLSVIKPRFSVICVGRNKYGQPDELAAANLSDYSGKVLTTMDDMAVEFYIDEHIKVKSFGGYYE